jgi:hypothetical protein
MREKQIGARGEHHQVRTVAANLVNQEYEILHVGRDHPDIARVFAMNRPKQILQHKLIVNRRAFGERPNDVGPFVGLFVGQFQIVPADVRYPRNGSRSLPVTCSQLYRRDKMLASEVRDRATRARCRSGAHFAEKDVLGRLTRCRTGISRGRGGDQPVALKGSDP